VSCYLNPDPRNTSQLVEQFRELAELAGALSAPLVEAKELRANLIRTGWVRFLTHQSHRYSESHPERARR
jgi:hypothetical protein